jgi:uncharacterized protein
MKEILIMTRKEEQNWVVFCHLGGLVYTTFLNIIIPLGMWLAKRNESAYVDEQGREIVNFQISMLIYFFGLFLLVFTVVGAPLAIVGFLGLLVVGIVSSIRGAMAASKGEEFLYPINLRLLK